MADTASPDGSTGGGAPAPPGVIVNPQSLQTFADDIDADIKSNVEPLIADFLETVVNSGAGRGARPGPAFITDVDYDFAQQVNRDHTDYADTLLQRLRQVQKGLEVISAAARLMAADYQSTDEQNSIDIVSANGYLGQAQRTVDAAYSAKDSQA